jgi:hypothetical protein
MRSKQIGDYIATTVKANKQTYYIFKVMGVRNGFTLQMLFERCLYRYVFDEEFRKGIDSFQVPILTTTGDFTLSTSAPSKPATASMPTEVTDVFSDSKQAESPVAVEDVKREPHADPLAVMMSEEITVNEEDQVEMPSLLELLAAKEESGEKEPPVE